MSKHFCFFFIIIQSALPIFAQLKTDTKLTKKAAKRLEKWQNPHKAWDHLGTIKIDSISINSRNKEIEVYFSSALSYLPVREDIYLSTFSSIEENLGRKFGNFEIIIKTDGQTLQSLIPNYFRNEIANDDSRLNSIKGNPIPLVKNMHRDIPELGLYNKCIALWHSHGWYYEAKLDRWEWQRARLFGTVEDLSPMTYILPYLVPMLENASANVFLPRERDVQVNEVIVDNDRSTTYSGLSLSNIRQIDTVGRGFMMKDTLFVGENPFRHGTSLRHHSTNEANKYLRYVPFFPADDNYAVYVSFVHAPENVSNAKYVVYHTGGKTEFSVNQKMGGGTWIYLGTFKFEHGRNAAIGSVLLSTESDQNGWVSADAVKFGGGIGNVARKPAKELLPNQWSLSGGQKESIGDPQKVDPDQFQWKTSGRPRYQEGARYYLQYAGCPDTLVYSLNEEKNDYNDDYQSRGEWVNFLMGSPKGPNVDRNAEGLNIPIDLSLAFHTDAGITAKDSTVGTLAIYSSKRDNGKFPDGQSKEVNRELTDIIQTEIVHDIRKQFKPDWQRRGLWNKEYSEAWRPNTPAMLLELLSHQNLSEVHLGHDPRFKFAVSRAIYKGIVKFLAFQDQSDFVIQPLPVDHLSMRRIDEMTIHLSWQPVLDTLEPTAVPMKYKVYKRIGNNGFDNGQIVLGTEIELEIDEFNTINSYKVTALNDGGESMPSEILSVGFTNNDKKPVLVVNAFDRISAPAIYDEGDFGGIAHWEDEGVPDKFDIGYTGRQYDYSRRSKWLDDDSPGWGASYGDMEGLIIPGNSFDNTYVHGKAILEAGYSFISASDEAFSHPDFNTESLISVVIIFGEEKTAETMGGNQFKVFDRRMRDKIKSFTNRGGNVFASGAYIGSDHILNKDTITQNFAKDVLHFQWRTNHAVRSGKVLATDIASTSISGEIDFNTAYHPDIYKVEAPDAIEPFGEYAITAFRYKENNSSAGVLYNGIYKVVTLGFPFETIIEEKVRTDLMIQVLDFFE